VRYYGLYANAHRGKVKKTIDQAFASDRLSGSLDRRRGPG
jgi:hypothetical protein